MNKNEIVRRYKRLSALRLMLPVIPAVISAIIMLLLDGWRDVSLMMGICCTFLWFGTILYPLSYPLISHLEKRGGMTEEEIIRFISKREFFGRNPVKYVFPFIREICKLNKRARKEQEIFLSDVLGEEEIEIIFNNFRKLNSLEDAILCWQERPLVERVKFMEFLFKLAIEQDGIHNDEWNMLMNLTWQLRFNKCWREIFRDNYSSLRTEFYDYEHKSSTSTEDHSTSTNNRSSSLKPYFILLGLEETASDEEIKRAYHNLALQHHPDLPKNADRIKECEVLMKKINEAYEKIKA